MIKTLCFYLLFLSILLSCDRIWDRYEPVLQEKPDSALRELLSINPEHLLSPKEKADYHLLLCMALDKSYIDLSTDSLIMPAVKYYANRQPVKKRMMAYYYLGRLQSNGHRLAEASFSFEKAEKYALLENDAHYLGLIYRNLGYLYEYAFDYQQVVANFEKSLYYFILADEKIYLDNARLELAIAYNNNTQPDNSERLFQYLMQQDTMDSSLRDRVHLSYARKLSGMGNEYAKEAYSFFNKADRNKFSSSDFGAMAVSAFLSGDTLASRHYLSIADSLSTTDTEKAAIDFFRFRLAYNNGKNRQAISYLQNAVHCQDSLLHIMLNQSVSAARSAFFKNEAEKQWQRNQIQRGILFTVIAIGILAILLLAIRHKNRIQNDMALIGETRQKLEITYRERDLLANSIISHQINELHLITEEYYKSDSPTRKEKYFRAFEKTLDEFRRHDSDLVNLEQSVNQFKGNAMQLLREEFPGETRHFYRMCTFYFAGFPYDLIHLLTKSTVPTLKAGKSHIKKQILSSDAPHKELFLALLDSAEKKPAGRPKKA